MKKKNHWKNICALFFAFCMVFSTVAGDASFVTAYAAEVQTAAGSEAAENPSPAEESGADSTEGAQNTINQESATQTGNAGQTDAAQTEGAVQTDAAQTDGAAQADAVQNTESGADQNTALIQTAGAESLAAFSYTAAPEAGLPAAATAGSGTLDVSGASYSGFSKGIAAKGWSEGAGFTVAVNAAGYTDLKFSADMRSSGTGPANFALEYSIDGASWTKISGTDVTLSTSLASVYQQTALPAALSGKAFTLRVTMQGNTSVNQSTVGTNGVTSINNIVVTGTQGEVATDGTVCSKVKASVEPGDVEAGTKVELSCATEGATITYHTDLDNADKTYTEALVIEEDVTIYATAEL
ncbi:chitobiase/beta-hexosaminidase C-terminal domain-containing protein, partial [Roseburia hominis]